MTLIRRLILVLMLALPVCIGGTATAQGAPPRVTAADQVLGDPNAPVTVIEYGSFACPHCAEWQIGVFRAFKERYIDTGQVRFVFRDLPTQPVQEAIRSASIARCAAPGRYFDVVHTLFLWQGTARNIGPVSEWYSRAVAETGRTPEEIAACMADPAVEAAIWRTAQGGSAAGATKTPTFFVNGQKMEGVVPIEHLAAAIDPLLNR
ncbi:DsbA family protein [Brevundimonas sp.]|uniref:DsbA family protein n=1 Tax=Brevundimonas sp. TaxID=1871086 RepID=UPI0025BA7549|nr:DsbA family protein [Brevundimonas sp.]